MIKSIFNILLLLIITYILFLSYFYFFQNNFVFFPKKSLDSDDFTDFEDIYIETNDKNTINCWFFENKNSDKVIIFFHGNAGNISDRKETINFIHKTLGFSLFIFDYRGFGKSSGKISEKVIYNDNNSIYNYITDILNYSPENIILWGRSLGGAIAIDLASKKEIAAMIIESTFTSLPDIAKEYYPFLPVSIITRYKFNSLKKVALIKYPKLFIHSKQDEIVPYKFGKTLFQKSLNPKKFLEINGVHNDGWITSKQKYLSHIISFLSNIEKREDTENKHE